MTVLYSKKGLPNKVADFSLKLRVMIDRCHNAQAAKYYKPSTNVIVFPTNKNKFKNHAYSNLYLQACQRLLGPVREFFCEEEEGGDAGGDGGFSVYALDAYLEGLNTVQKHCIGPPAEQQLDTQEQRLLQVDVVQLQVAGFEYTTEQQPEIVAAYGEQLMARHLPVFSLDLTHGDIAFEMKQAYADVNGMIEQAKKVVSATLVPKFSRS